jgi:hypothetical protein
MDASTIVCRFGINALWWGPDVALRRPFCAAREMVRLVARLCLYLLTYGGEA